MKRLRLTILTLLLAAGVAPMAATRGQPAGKSAKVAVAMKDMKFSPDSVTIKVGDTVVWTNDDDHDHTVVADDGSFKSEKIGHGETFKHTFDKKGKFKYSCSYHPRMKGVIVVTD